MSGDQNVSRKYTTALLDVVSEGFLDHQKLIAQLIGWMSEDDVKDFILSEGLEDFIGLDEEPVDIDESQEEDPDCWADPDQWYEL